MKFFFALFAGFTLLSAGAIAADFTSIQTPSKNIHCMFTEDMGGAVNCEIMEINGALPHKPADCDLDYGNRYAMDSTGEVSLPCYGDTVRNTDAGVVAYGHSFELYGITCQSKKTGLTCTNQDGHGFSLSRARQEVY